MYTIPHKINESLFDSLNNFNVPDDLINEVSSFIDPVNFIVDIMKDLYFQKKKLKKCKRLVDIESFTYRFEYKSLFDLSSKDNSFLLIVYNARHFWRDWKFENLISKILKKEKIETVHESDQLLLFALEQMYEFLKTGDFKSMLNYIG